MLKYSECGGSEAPGTHYGLEGSEVGTAGREGDRYGGLIISSLALLPGRSGADISQHPAPAFLARTLN